MSAVSQGPLSALRPRRLLWFPNPLALSLDVRSHVYGPVLAWLHAWRWWTAADCSDSLALIVCCAPHNGPTHGKATPSFFTVRLLAVLIGFSV